MKTLIETLRACGAAEADLAADALEASLQDRVALAMQVERLTAERNELESGPLSEEAYDIAQSEIRSLTTDRDALRLAAQAGLDALEHAPWKNWRTDKAITQLQAALKQGEQNGRG